MRLGGFAIVVAQQSAESLTATDLAFLAADLFLLLDQLVSQALVVSLMVIMDWPSHVKSGSCRITQLAPRVSAMS